MRLIQSSELAERGEWSERYSGKTFLMSDRDLFIFSSSAEAYKRRQRDLDTDRWVLCKKLRGGIL